MHVMILGAAGMVGRKLVEKIAREPLAFGRPVTRLTLADAFQPPVPEPLRPVSTALTVDLAGAGAADRLIEGRPDLIFHL
ncbi:NAD-dependent epimerase/dehydratase family protein, partial [Pseudomonas sp. BGM005]|nr:NAD-dependent epimerase/dehydratase family protein [Pseudomonas sp. BG5]